MFWKKSKKTNPYFIFNLGCKNPLKCLAFSIEDGFAAAEWYGDEGERNAYSGVPVTEELWAVLTAVVTQHGMLNWQAHKLCNRFVSEVSPDVFNGEGLFPDGKTFAANNMHGMPEGFEAAAEDIKKLFAALKP